jgi:hypothetical protein
MTSRHETITEAHKKTLEWIFRDPMADGNSWSNFGKWLQFGSSIYWIYRKAGSGKSTLMKFIVDHSQTQALLTTHKLKTNLVSGHEMLLLIRQHSSSGTAVSTSNDL